MDSPHETYLDHNASAPLLPEAREAILGVLDLGPGNPSSSHAAGRRLRRVLGDAREAVAELAGADASEVVFTSGTSESNQLAIRGLLRARGDGPRRLILTEAAHDGVDALANALSSEGVSVVRTGVRDGGRVDVEALVSTANAGTPSVVTLAAAQSVTGAIQPVAEIVSRLGDTPVHCDGAQLVGRSDRRLHDLGAAVSSFSAHKIGGPRGIGALVIRADASFDPPGGEAAQERGRRAGTEAVALAAGFAAAASVAARATHVERGAWRELLGPLRDYIHETAGAEILTPELALPNTLLVRFADCPGDAVAMALDAARVQVSTGTACASGARTPPRVLIAGGRSATEAAECIRVSVGHGSSARDVQRLVEALRDALPRVRNALGTATTDSP